MKCNRPTKCIVADLFEDISLSFHHSCSSCVSLKAQAPFAMTVWLDRIRQLLCTKWRCRSVVEQRHRGYFLVEMKSFVWMIESLFKRKVIVQILTFVFCICFYFGIMKAQVNEEGCSFSPLNLYEAPDCVVCNRDYFVNQTVITHSYIT